MKIEVVGKYKGIKDEYKYIIEEMNNGGMENKVKVNIEWIEEEVFEREEKDKYMEKVNGIMVKGGFGESGDEGKIIEEKLERERKVNYLGI